MENESYIYRMPKNLNIGINKMIPMIKVLSELEEPKISDVEGKRYSRAILIVAKGFVITKDRIV